MPTVQSINVINVGNVPITADGVATFSGNYSQYLKLPADFNPGTKDFTYVVDFTPSNNYLTYTYIAPLLYKHHILDSLVLV